MSCPPAYNRYLILSLILPLYLSALKWLNYNGLYMAIAFIILLWDGIRILEDWEMNYPSFLRQLRSENIFKISDKLKTFDIHLLPTRKIVIKQYECKKAIKTIQAKQRVQDFILFTVSD